VRGLKTIKKNSELDFDIIPDPADELLHVQFRNIERGSVQIINMDGIRVYKNEIENGDVVSISAFAPGVYLFCVEELEPEIF